MRMSKSLPLAIVAVGVLVLVFQNCARSGSGSQIESSIDPQSLSLSATACSQNLSRGVWTTNLEQPDHPEAEAFSFHDDCSGSSKRCELHFEFSETAIDSTSAQLNLNIISATSVESCPAPG